METPDVLPDPDVDAAVDDAMQNPDHYVGLLNERVLSAVKNVVNKIAFDYCRKLDDPKESLAIYNFLDEIDRQLPND